MYFLERIDQTIKKIKLQTANFVTLANLSFGGAAILTSINENYSYSVLFIFIAALLDRFDGMIARKYNMESELGKQLDSMSDIISFGVAPAILLFMTDLVHFGAPGMVMTILYIAAGALRLARFNITESNGYFTGLPITAAGTLLTLSYLGITLLPSVFYMFMMPLLAILMISNFQLKKI
ncbi:CDP-diacylglycerol--serine O-phosphatidyltransferase [Paenisporosarcina cavernae]|uniref:CDP-diacylglycerol--serine O-phosphatidyltransferase n=1 Tax=Paenisporosarcina cavernae TaxID=2320858 RepID=A0A385YSP4_9BACL|nr:CDP-diacylglycerol--serine O-phosphatidyltransferase [Paenisporosarcina cavernae]AYC29696.1 CDP-diacylglycerol--serine O-phosphatidyltransferase [Paenisporosarcina cavernae]